MERWILKAQKGNRKAFIKCIQPYEADLYRMAYVYMKNEQDALDIVQETILKAFESIHTLREPAYLKTWLIKININCCLKKIRQTQKIVYMEPQQVERWSEKEKDISLQVVLEKILNEISLEEKQILLLKYYQGYTFEEISGIVDMPLGTVKSLLYRALKKCKVQIEEVDFYE